MKIKQQNLVIEGGQISFIIKRMPNITTGVKCNNWQSIKHLQLSKIIELLFLPTHENVVCAACVTIITALSMIAKW